MIRAHSIQAEKYPNTPKLPSHPLPTSPTTSLHIPNLTTSLPPQSEPPNQSEKRANFESRSANDHQTSPYPRGQQNFRIATDPELRGHIWNTQNPPYPREELQNPTEKGVPHIEKHRVLTTNMFKYRLFLRIFFQKDKKQ